MPRLARPPGHRSPAPGAMRATTGVSAASLAARSAVSACLHIRWNKTGRTAIGSPAAAAPAISGDRLGENLQQQAGQARRAAAPRMPVPRQPRDVRRQHRIRDAYPPETPPGQPACTLHDVECLRVPRLDPVIGTNVDDQAGPIGHPGEQVRRVTPGPARIITPAQPERLRRYRGDQRVEVQQQHMVTLKPGLVPDMRPGGHRPPQAGQVLLASGPAELPAGGTARARRPRQADGNSWRSPPPHRESTARTPGRRPRAPASSACPTVTLHTRDHKVRKL